jgi:DNA polymerase-3 subunit delta'
VPESSGPQGAGVFAGVVGQRRAVAMLRAFAASPVHAYLLVGPPGSGLDEVGLAFAAALVCQQGGCGVCEQCRAALAGSHPDVVVFARAGAKLSVGQAQEAVQRSLRSPRAARRQVLVLTELHLVEDAAPVLLKAVEEPPATTVFVLLAENVPPELDTIASRCARVDLEALDEATVAAVLVAEGSDAERAAAVAAAAGGRLDRARLLAGDEGFAARLALWRAVPDRLDGTGATVSILTAELLASIAEPAEVLREAHARELRELTARASERGDTVRGRAEIDARHRREQRRVRVDELRAGLGTLARAYRDRLASAAVPDRRAAEAITAVAAIDIAADELVRNPSEQLLLESLLLRLSGDGQQARRGSTVR